MPELPEVETIVRQLAPHILHKKIIKVEIFRPAQWKKTSPEKAINILTNNSMRRINRRAKFINIELENGYRLVLHLRMSGKLIWQNHWTVVDQYTRTIFYFEDHSSLQFNDTRALGTLDVFAPNYCIECLEILGIEPLGAEFDVDIVKQLLKNSKQEIKDFLMDQRKVCGIGNIYASEILFHAKIHPQRICNTLANAEAKKLARSICSVLNVAIDCMGTSLGDASTNYRTVYNLEGEFQNQLQVYGRAGFPCFTCGMEIQRIVQKGRSSYFCKHCQH